MSRNDYRFRYWDRGVDKVVKCLDRLEKISILPEEIRGQVANLIARSQ